VDLSENEELWNGDGDGRVLVAVARTENREPRIETREPESVLYSFVGRGKKELEVGAAISFWSFILWSFFQSPQLPAPSSSSHPPSPISQLHVHVSSGLV